MWTQGLIVLLCVVFLTCALPINQETDEEKKIAELEQKIQTVSRQLMMQQHYFEESIRSTGNSGLKRMRIDSQGTSSYHAGSHSDAQTIAAIHNHPNFQRMLGFGEIVAVMNGVEFRTRHNDYLVKMRHTTPGRRGYLDVPFPGVPKEVTSQPDLPGQISEMREWFAAWRDQDYSVRDYRPFFKPMLCYLEGAWTHSEPTSIDEPFESDRHHLDATNWLDLTEKIRFTSYSGSKDGLENLAYLPTTVIGLAENKIPILAQWNFRILCQPLKDDLPLARLRPVDDLSIRMANKGGLTMEEYEKTRSARFRLTSESQNGDAQYSLLDELMEQVPGADGYRNINDNAFNETIYKNNDMLQSVPLNHAFYHRMYRVKHAGASGTEERRRGFSDENLFVAQTTHPKIAGLTMKDCIGDQCTKTSQRWTYAIPLEIVYMNPLSTWNPHDIILRGWANGVEGRKILKGPRGRRNGGQSPDKAFNGCNSKKHFITPHGFFDDQSDRIPVDTVRNTIHVLNRDGEVLPMRNSGFWIHMPNIPGVGKLRQRYPIMPLYEEGTSSWKKIDALKSIALRPGKYEHFSHNNS